MKFIEKSLMEFLIFYDNLLLYSFSFFHPFEHVMHMNRLQKPYNDDDLEGSYFRRKPTSFLSSNDAKRYTWMAPEDEAVRAEGPRLLGGMQNGGGGPYIVGSYPPKSSFLSQSTDQITG